MLRSLLAQAAAEAQGKRGGELFLIDEARELADRLEQAVAEVVQPAAGGVLVGTFDGHAFGFSLWHTEHLGDLLVAKLSGFYVEPEARGVGIGEAMMEETLRRAQAAGCEGIDVHALPGDRATKNFFESFGMKARLLSVYRKLD